MQKTLSVKALRLCQLSRRASFMRYEDKRFLHPQEACFGQMKGLPLSGELARRKP